jgi:hypothetical protein
MLCVNTLTPKYCTLIVLVAKSTKSPALCELMLDQYMSLLFILLLKSTSCVSVIKEYSTVFLPTKKTFVNFGSSKKVPVKVNPYCASIASNNLLIFTAGK